MLYYKCNYNKNLKLEGDTVNNLSLKEEACKKAFYFKENSQKENLD